MHVLFGLRSCAWLHTCVRVRAERARAWALGEERAGQQREHVWDNIMIRSGQSFCLRVVLLSCLGLEVWAGGCSVVVEECSKAAFGLDQFVSMWVPSRSLTLQFLSRLVRIGSYSAGFVRGAGAPVVSLS